MDKQVEGGARSARIEQVTQKLPPRGFEVPQSMAEVLSGGPSPLGWHSISGYMACPESARLRALGVRRKRTAWEPQNELDALGYGNLIHAALAIRSIHGHAACMDWLEQMGRELTEPDYLKASFMLRVYDDTYPEASERLTVLGVETTIHTDVGGGVLRTVRYDAIAKVGSTEEYPWEVYSLERKTDSRGGFHAMQAYTPQGATQVALWNANPYLVKAYGPMRGVIFDVLVKTQVPRCERIPVEIPKVQQKLALEYLRQSETIRFPAAPDGSWPKFIHTCWGRYRPCEYVPLCWEGMVNEYEQTIEAAT